MESTANKTARWKKVGIAGVLALPAICVLAIKLQTKDSALAEETQMTFQSPVEAGTALAQASKNTDETTLVRILGGDAKTAVMTGDQGRDKVDMGAFVFKYEKMNRWVDLSDGSRVLYIGADNFAFPVPLAKNPSGQWYFDAVAGAQEIRARDIGRNELLAKDACAAIPNAQEIYMATVGSSPQFAQRIISTSGKQDGLYWPASAGQASSPLGDFNDFPKSSLGSASPQEPFVIDGYALRILTAQGDAAPGGAQNYIVSGKMKGGFAILATPAKYGETGIMTFMTGSNGIIYEQDLGPDTTKIAASIREFNPTNDWSPAE
jgi:hypothetical protein